MLQIDDRDDSIGNRNFIGRIQNRPNINFYILAIKEDAEMEALMLSINENNENDENFYDEDKFFVEISDQLP